MFSPRWMLGSESSDEEQSEISLAPETVLPSLFLILDDRLFPRRGDVLPSLVLPFPAKTIDVSEVALLLCLSGEV